MAVASVKPEAYRYRHEALGDISFRTSSLQQVLANQGATGKLILHLDGTLIDIDGVAIRKVIGHDRNIDDGDDPGYISLNIPVSVGPISPIESEQQAATHTLDQSLS